MPADETKIDPFETPKCPDQTVTAVETPSAYSINPGQTITAVEGYGAELPPAVPTPFADRAIAVVGDVVAAAQQLLSKAQSYHNPGNRKDMHPSVETALRLQVRTITAMLDHINCPMAFVPETANPKPPHFGEASAEEARLVKAKQERAKKLNSIPIGVAAKAKAQQREQDAMKAAQAYHKPEEK